MIYVLKVNSVKRMEERHTLQHLCREIRERTGHNVNCNSKNDVLIRYIEEHQPEPAETDADPSTLSSEQIDEYCRLHPTVCTDDIFWKNLTQNVFPDVYEAAKYITFPDFEIGMRSSLRTFQPWRELYMQLLVLNDDARTRKVFRFYFGCGDKPLMVSKANQEASERLRQYFQIVSWLLSCETPERKRFPMQWIQYLAAKDDALLDIIPMTKESMLWLIRQIRPKSPRLVRRFLRQYPGEDV